MADALRSFPATDCQEIKKSQPPSVPGFPVDLDGVGGLHAVFPTENRTTGCIQCSVAGNARDDKVEVSASMHVVADGWVDLKPAGNLISVRSRPS